MAERFPDALTQPLTLFLTLNALIRKAPDALTLPLRVYVRLRARLRTCAQDFMRQIRQARQEIDFYIVFPRKIS